MRAIPILILDRHCVALTALACLLYNVESSGNALTCEAQLDGAPLLGSHAVQTRRNDGVLVRIAQNDLDVRVVVRSGERQKRFDGPGGRNGIEWIDIDSKMASQHRVCVYAVYRQPRPGAYRFHQSSLDDANAAEREALRLLSEASRLWATSTFESRSKAIDMYERVAGQRVARFDASKYAQLYSALGRAQRYQYDQALAALDKLSADASTYVRYNAQWAAGLILNRAGDLPKSRAALEGALATTELHGRTSEHGVRRDIADITNLLGEVHLSEGDLATGERLIRKALELAQDDDQLRGAIYNNLGYVYLRQADFDTGKLRSKYLGLSIAAHSQAQEFARRAGDRLELSIIQNNLATLFERVGDISNARRYFETALRTIDATDDPYRFKTLYRGLGNIYLTLGDYTKSRRFIEASLEIGAHGFEDHDTRLYCRLGIVNRLEGALQHATAAHRTCREWAERRGDFDVLADALNELSIDYAAQHSTERAWEASSRAIAMMPEVRDRDVRSKVMTQHALELQSRGNKDEARQYARAAIEASVMARYPTTKIDALAAAATIHREQGYRSEARSFALLAVNAIEDVHAHLDAERLGPAWSARTQEIYSQLINDLLAPGARRPAGLREAFDVIERARAISLRQQLSAPEGRAQQVRDDPTIIALSDLANSSAAAQTDELGMPLAYYHQHDLLTLSRLAGAAELPVPRPLTVAEIQKSLGDSQLALSYSIAGDSVYLFAIGPKSFEFFDLGDSASLEQLTKSARTQIAQRLEDSHANLRALSARILPAERLVQARELIVVRDGILSSLPFGALRTGSGDAGAPLISRLSIRIVPSLSAYFMPKKPRPESFAVDLAIFADPIFATDSQSADRDSNDFSGWTQTLRRLPWTAREAERISAQFPAAKTLVFTGERATRQSLRSTGVANARILHIASHGYVATDNPDNVGFALSPGRSGSHIDSGFITLTELFSYPFDNELVVISGCETAVGAEKGGEGALSLTRGFLAQGSSHVLSTLWEVSDRASADFMTIFYENIAAGRSIGDALRLTQNDLSQKPQYRDPFFWAPYILTSVSPRERLSPLKIVSARASDSGNPPPIR